MRLVLGVLGTVLLAWMPASAQHVRLVTEEQPPMNYADPVDGSVRGISTELIAAMMKAANLTFDVTLMPWKRAYRLAQAEENVCVYTTVRTPAREPEFKWVAPLFKSGWAFYKAPGSGVVIDTVEDLRNYIVSATTETLAISGIREQLGVQVVEVPRDSRALKLVYDGRADVWVSGIFTAFSVSGFVDKPLPELAFLWHTMELGLACNKATDDDIVARLNAANQTLNPLRDTLAARHHYFAEKQD